jgi:predicted lipoprotein with Yx(FWY)xxD motif
VATPHLARKDDTVHLRHRRRGRLTAVAALGLLPLALVSACGTGSQAATAAEAVATPVYTTDADAPVNNATLSVTSSGLGRIVVDNQGFTLYVYAHDSASPPKATCDGECALTWEPVSAQDGSVTVEGVGQGLVGEVTRTDGTKQMTLGGWPLYRYAPDQKPGDTTGQGQGGLWVAIGPDGK